MIPPLTIVHCCRRKFGGDWSETRDFSCSITVHQSDKTVWSENNYTDLTKKLKKNLKRKMKIISRSAAPFSSIISVFLLTVICQNEASKLKRLDQAVSKAHFEFSLDLYKTLGKYLQFIFKRQKKIFFFNKSFMYISIIFTVKKICNHTFILIKIHTLKSFLQSHLNVKMSFFWRENLKKIFPHLFSIFF